MENAEKKIILEPNTSPHETAMSEWCKNITAGALELISTSLEAASECIETDPLKAEKYIHNIEILSGLATNMYVLAEDAKENSKKLAKEKR
jgi:hypothetical protein